MLQPVPADDQALPYSYPFISGPASRGLILLFFFFPFLALNQGRRFAVAVGFKQEPKGIFFLWSAGRARASPGCGQVTWK